MLYRVSQFGGFIEIGGRKLSVRGRTLRLYAEFESLWLSMSGDPVGEVLRLLVGREAEPASEILAAALKKIRLCWLADAENMKHRLASTCTGRIFILWQCIRHNCPDISLDWVEQALDRKLNGDNEQEFWRDVERKISIASGEDSIGELFDVHKPVSAIGTRQAISLVGTVTELAKSKVGLSYSEILDMTIREIRTLAADKKDLVDTCREESMVPDGDPMQKMHSRNYEREARRMLGLPPKIRVRTSSPQS